MLTTTLSSLALAAVAFLVKRVETPFLSLFAQVHLTTQSLLAASTTSVGSFAVLHGHWISVTPVTTMYSTLAVFTSLMVSFCCDCPNTVPIYALNLSRQNKCVFMPLGTNNLVHLSLQSTLEVAKLFLNPWNLGIP